MIFRVADTHNKGFVRLGKKNSRDRGRLSYAWSHVCVTPRGDTQTHSPERSDRCP